MADLCCGPGPTTCAISAQDRCCNEEGVVRRGCCWSGELTARAYQAWEPKAARQAWRLVQRARAVRLGGRYQMKTRHVPNRGLAKSEERTAGYQGDYRIAERHREIEIWFRVNEGMKQRIGSFTFLSMVFRCRVFALAGGFGGDDGGGALGVGWDGGVASPRQSPSSPETGAEPASGRRRGCWAAWRQPVSAARMGRALAGKAARSAAFI